MTSRRVRRLVIAARPSRLARAQAEWVGAALAARWAQVEPAVHVIRTRGDATLDRPLPEIGGKGLFAAELEEALLQGEVDLAVHSLKDLLIEPTPGIRLAAVPAREDPRDVLVSARHPSLAHLPQGAVVGTSSLRRQAQLLGLRPDLRVESIRGNVETRVSKVVEGRYAAAVLAAAGLNRLGLEAHIVEWFALAQMLPAPGQGAIAVQCREEDHGLLDLLRAIDAPEIRRAVEAERAFLEALGGGCLAPVGAYGCVQDGQVRLMGLIASPDGRRSVRVEGDGPDPFDLGRRLAVEAAQQGAGELLAHV